MATTIKNGNFDLHSSGRALVDSTVSTVIKVIQEDENLTFVFNFKSVAGNTPVELQARIDIVTIDNLTLGINFINFVSPISTFSRDFVQVGILKNRRLYFAYNVQSFPGTKLKDLGFSFYFGEVVVNG